MKQLKFMLAAATAIGLATAAQADTQLVKTEISSENFDAVTTLENTAALMALDGFTYEGATATDNESYVAAGGANSTANALKVNTGTDPLLRKIDTDTNNAITLDPTGAKKVYIDTMVQFTVTPYGDTVSSNGVNDKLMIYLKEMTNVVDGVVTITGTNLMVKAAKYTPANPLPPSRPASFDVVDAKISNVTVEPNKWYRLVVTTCLNSVGFVQFTIQIGEEGQEALVTLKNTDGLLATDDTVFPSLLGTSSATLDQVGFAGEGMVDELVFSHDVEQQTSVDFTFTLGTGVSAVTWTINNVTQSGLAGKVTAGQTIAITGVTYADWYGPTGTYVKDWSGVWGTDVTADITVEAKKLAEVANDGSVVIESTTTPAALNIMTGSFASEAAGSEELAKAVKWATSKGDATASTVGSTVGALNFADSEETQAEKAYLLNVADNAEAVAAAIAAFKFEAFDPKNPPAATYFDGKGYNGTVTIKGATAVDGAWGDADANSKFFKAVLTK